MNYQLIFQKERSKTKVNNIFLMYLVFDCVFVKARIDFHLILA